MEKPSLFEVLEYVPDLENTNQLAALALAYDCDVAKTLAEAAEIPAVVDMPMPFGR